MKRKKAQPSVAGLLLIVTGMLLISMVLLVLASSQSTTKDQGMAMIVLGCVALLCLSGGTILSRSKKKSGAVRGPQLAARK